MSRRFRLTSGRLTGGVAVLAASTTMVFCANGNAPASAVNAASETGADRGQPVSVTPVRVLSDEQAVAKELASDGFDSSSVRYGVRAYRLVYRTVDPEMRPTTASGLLVMPINRSHRLTMVSFTHGTESYRGDAPSAQPSGFDPAPAYTYASAGFVVAEPDYLGLGVGPGPHPWMDVPSETTATLDMLRAVRSYVGGKGYAVQDRVMVTGFSQGASAALGLARALDDGADPRFRLGALAPISGAYDLEHAELPAILDGRLVKLNPNPQLGAKISVLYAAYTLVGMDRVHHVYDTPSEVFQSPYAGTIEQLLDGDHTGDQLFGGTPGTLEELLTSKGLALLRHPVGGLAAGLRIADAVCTGWSPSAPTRLYMADADEQAVNANTTHCQTAFAASHRAVPVIDLGTPDNQGSRHYGSNAAATARILTWFTQLAH